MKPRRACTERSRSIDFHKSAGLSRFRYVLRTTQPDGLCIETDSDMSKSEFRPTYYTRRKYYAQSISWKDPYLEDPAIWPEVHQRLITYTADALRPLLRSTHYRARINERVILLGEQKVRTIYPDVSVSLTADFMQSRINGNETPVDKPTIAIEADKPVVVIESTEVVEPFLEIRLARGGALVTVIEILSPVNKTTGSPMYREKQTNILIHGINLVEIDLLRDGGHVLAVSPHEIANLIGDYWVCVSRATSLAEYEVYPIPLRGRLPRISIPLCPPDADVVLDLPSVFDRCYDNGDFAREIDYNTTPEIPLSPADAMWADTLLRGKGIVN